MGAVAPLGFEPAKLINNTSCSLVLAKRHRLPMIKTTGSCFRSCSGGIGEIKQAERFEVKEFDREVTTVITVANVIITVIIAVDSTTTDETTVAIKAIIVIKTIARMAITSEKAVNRN
jgi:hypothetical protein